MSSSDRAVSPPVLELWTDGSAEGKAGRPGGWAFIVVDGDREVATGSGGSGATTGVLMEIEAAWQALRWAEAHAGRRGLELVSDSSIVLEAAVGRFFPRPYETQARALFELATRLRVTARKVRAHTGLRWNELADARALEAKRAEGVPPARRPRSRRAPRG